jgi:hypothetical protein
MQQVLVISQRIVNLYSTCKQPQIGQENNRAYKVHVNGRDRGGASSAVMGNHVPHQACEEADGKGKCLPTFCRTSDT